MKKFKTKIKRAEAEGLRHYINEIICQMYGSEADEDNMLTAALVQIYLKIEEKLLIVKPVYSITLTPVEAFAIRVVNRDFSSNNIYVNNHVLQLSNVIHQHYQ